jgi:hypothetical protein
MYRRDGSFGDATHGTPNSVGFGKPTGRESERKETMHVAFKHLLIFSLSSAVNEWHSPIRAKKYRYYWYTMYVRTGKWRWVTVSRTTHIPKVIQSFNFIERAYILYIKLNHRSLLARNRKSFKNRKGVLFL